MPPVTLEGDTLGEKHQHFNKLVEDAIANEHYELRNIIEDDSDIDNLLKIEIASKIRNVDYIIEVMKSNDMLYAATAIKKSTWLITDPQYAKIINPEYLHTQLLPSMNNKTFNNLLLHIRLNLKDESRVEAFYEYLREKDSAYKWLQNCSIPFIENVIKYERLIPRSLFKRLCKRSPNFIACHTRVIEERNRRRNNIERQEILYNLKSHTEQVLDVLELDHLHFNFSLQLGKKKTEFLMKAYTQRVFANFSKYVCLLDLSVVAKYLNKKEIKTFLKKHVPNETQSLYCLFLFDYDTLGHFIRNMSEDESFEFVRKTFINKTELAAFYPEFEKNHGYIKSYQWYEFAPFNVAFSEIKKLIRKENALSERLAMLSVLITCARRKAEHIKTLLKFFEDKHMNESFTLKIQFVNDLLPLITTYEIDVETWNVLDQLFHSMEVYIESENDVQTCLEFIFLYKVLHDEPVPEILLKKMIFHTFAEVQNKLNQEQRSKVFTYLFDSVLSKLRIENVANESDFTDTMVHLRNALALLRDWKKDISKYPYILDKIQELNKIKQENTWKTDMSCLYDMKKSWRKHMFEESLSLCLCEETCLNALKHKPQLLTRHDEEIDRLRTNDAVSLRRLLTKLRVYWPHSLAQHWTDAYLVHLNKSTGQKAVIKGLFSLLPQNKIVDMAKQHIPDDLKVNWGETDQNVISIKKNIAKHLYIVRPLIPLDTVLWYASGDYLQHTVPSLNAILPNLSVAEIRKYLPKLLNAPVSLQKIGLNLAVSKLTSEDLKAIFLNIWKTSKNLTIRSVLFSYTYDQMRKAHDPTVQKEFWEILSYFIDNLTAGESKEIYKKFAKLQNVPISIRAEFYMKSYEFLTSLPSSANCENYVKGFIEYAPNIMEILDEHFVVNKMLSPVETKFCSYESEVLEVLACYVLCGKSEEDQLQRFRKFVEPAMDKSFQLWNTMRSGNYYIRDNFNKFLQSLAFNFRIYFLSCNEKAVPVKLFLEIKTKLEKKLPLFKNYVLYTGWKLVTGFIMIINEQKTTLVRKKIDLNNIVLNWMPYDIEYAWKDIQNELSPILGPMFVKYLKEDTEQHKFSTIYCLFTEAFVKMNMLFKFPADVVELDILRHMLNDYDFVTSYFLVSNLAVKYCSYWRDVKPKLSEIHKILESHPSKAVQMYYLFVFRKM